MIEEQEGYYIGVDWGLNKTGLAIADNELKIATVLSEVDTVNLIAEIKKIELEYKIIKVIFGGLNFAEQFNTNNEDDQRINKQKKQAVEDIKTLKLELEMAEEMLTTKMAQQNLLEGGKSRVSKQDNSEAAKIILQGWLDNN